MCNCLSFQCPSQSVSILLYILSSKTVTFVSSRIIRPYPPFGLFRNMHLWFLLHAHHGEEEILIPCFSVSQWNAFVLESRFSPAHVLCMFFGAGSRWSAQRIRSLCLKMCLSASDFGFRIPLTEQVQEAYAVWNITATLFCYWKFFAYGHLSHEYRHGFG